MEHGAHVVGIFGGSFDPPHVGHVALIEAAFEALGLPEIWVIPAGHPVHRTLSGHASPDVRLHWLQRIFSLVNFPQASKVRVQDWETGSEQPLASIDTLRHIRRTFPALHPVLLLGADAFAGMSQWVEYPKHQLLCDVAVFDRTGHTYIEQQEWKETRIATWKHEAGSGRLLYVHKPLPDMSATMVRRQATAALSLAGMVPACVCQDIEQAYGRSKCEHKH